MIWGRGRLLALLILLSLGLSISHNNPLASTFQTPVQASPPAYATVFLSAADGTNHTNDVGHSLTTVTFSVNATNSPDINSFGIFLDYNTTILTVKNVVYSDNFLGSAGNIILFCIDGQQQQGSRACLAQDTPGTIHLAMNILGNQTLPVTSKGLMHMTFNIIGTGLAQIHIISAQLAGLSPTGPYDVPLLPNGDAYYTNVDCPRGSGIACKPPGVSVVFSPREPSQGTAVTFNVTATDSNSGGRVVLYAWDWGDDTPPQNQSITVPPFLNQTIQHKFSLAPFGGIGLCVASGNCTVTLSVFDNEGIIWKTGITVSIFRLFIEVSVGEVGVSPLSPIETPGTIIHFNATIVNSSTIAEKASLNITLEGKTLLKMPTGGDAKADFTLPASGGTGTMAAVWDTTGATARVYSIIMTVGNVISADKQVTVQHPEGEYLTFQNTTENTIKAVYILLVVPQISNGLLSLDLIQTTGVGILVVAASVFALTRLKKKPSYETEPLDVK